MSRKPSRKKGASIELNAELQQVRLELEVNHLNIDPIADIGVVPLLEEIRFVLNPILHEGRIASYGSILYGQNPPGGLFEQVQTQGEVGLSLIREVADGEKRFVLFPGSSEPHIGLLRDSVKTELDALNLSRLIDALVLKRTETGQVTIVYREEVFTIRGRQWLRRKPIAEMIADLIAAVPMLKRDLAMKIIELGCYILSPLGIGTTLVWFINEPSLGEVTDDNGIRALRLNCAEESAYATIVHLASQMDGAFILGPDGDMRAAGIHLSCERRTEDLISKYKGTRHTSAKRYSFEHEKVVVVVVSQDGFVTVFSDGAKISDSPLMRAREEVKFLKAIAPGRREDVSSVYGEVTCPSCGKFLHIETVVVIGMKEPEEAECPVCGEVVDRAMCWSNRAFLRKQIRGIV